MKSAPQYLLVIFVFASLLVLGVYMVKDTQAQTALNLPSSNMVSNANFSLMCGIYQDQAGVQRQKIILLDNRTGDCKSLEQSPISQGCEWVKIR